VEQQAESPIIVGVLLFAARCIVPLLLMLGVSYLLRRWGLIAEPPPPPPNNGANENNGGQPGGAHGKA